MEITLFRRDEGKERFFFYFISVKPTHNLQRVLVFWVQNNGNLESQVPIHVSMMMMRTIFKSTIFKVPYFSGFQSYCLLEANILMRN